MKDKTYILTNEELKKLQNIQLEMLIEFDKICKRNNLKYTLVGGTLIGAIRHNGFIPWDDDIDIMMPRDDYNKFIKVQKKELDKKKYYFQSMETDSEWDLFFGKIRRKGTLYSEINSNRKNRDKAIWIDIFPADKIKSNNFFSKLYYFRVYALKIIYSYKTNYLVDSNTKKKKMILNFVKMISIFYNTERLKKKLLKLITKYNSKDTNYYASYSGSYMTKEIFHKKIFDEIIEHKFENKMFSITAYYDEYLRNIYSDYMKLPPKEKQVAIHKVSEIKFPKESKK